MAFEAGRDGFWLARWLRARAIEAYVIHPTSIPVSREHRRAKTDRLDIGLLKRAFLGWLRGEPGHCSMAAIPTLEEEDAKRPTRERESLVGDRTRITNRLKAAFTRLGNRGFNPKFLCALQHLSALRTPGEPIPPNTLAELQRDMARLRFISDQITPWCSWWRASEVSASKRRRCSSTRCFHETCAIDVRLRATPVSPAHLTRAAASGGRRASQRQGTLGCAGA